MTVARRRLASAAQWALVLVAFLSSTAGTSRAHGFEPPSRGVLLTFAADASGYVGNDIRGWNVGGRIGFVGFTEVAVGFQQDGPVYVHGLVGVGLPHVVSVAAGLARIEGRPALLAAVSVGWGFRVD